MNAKGLTIFKIIISLISCIIFVWASWQPSPFTFIPQVLIPVLLLLLSFYAAAKNENHKTAIFGAVGAALGYNVLTENKAGTSPLAFTAILLASTPFFYCILSACCRNAHGDVEQKLQSFTESKLFFYLCLTVATVGLAAQFIFSFSPNIWVDEAFSIALTAHPWGEMLSIAATDVHPPLYYIILKASTGALLFIFPDASPICIGKLVSVLPFALLMWIAVTKVRRTWGNYVGGLWCAALFAAPSLIPQGVEIRMYGWAMLFLTLAYLFAYDVINKARKRDWCWFALAGLTSAYTHYYACIAVTPVYLLLLYTSFRKGRANLLRWGLAATVTVVGYLPWLFIFINQAQTVAGNYWISYPNLAEYQRYAVGVLQNPLATGVVFLIIFLLLISLCRGKGSSLSEGYILTGVFCGAATLAVGLAATYLIRPVFTFRYIYPGLACFWLALIIGTKCSGKSAMRLSLALILAGSSISQFLEFGLYEGKQAKELIRWTEALNRHPDAVLITNHNIEQRTFSTLTGRTCLTFDKEENTELFKQVFPVCRQSNIADIQSFLNQEKHPTYIVLLTGPAPGEERLSLSRQYYVGKFLENGYFDMYVIPAKGNGMEL